jgi:DcmR-like sensory protein
MSEGLMRRSGIEGVRGLPWGAHGCFWYRDRLTLLDLLVPYFAAGLEDNEQCLWVTGPPLSAQCAGDYLLVRVPDLRMRVAAGQLCIVDHSAWFARGHTDPHGMYASLMDATNTAVSRGYAGLRAGGNTGFLETPEDYRAYERYESGLTQALSGHRFLALCCYDIARVPAADARGVNHNHQFCVPEARGGCHGHRLHR